MRRIRALLLTLVVVALALGGYGWADVTDHAPGILTRDEPVPAGAAQAVPAAARPTPVLATDPATAPVPTRAGLARDLRAPLRAPGLGPSVGVVVRDGVTGETLFEQAATAPRVVASAQKLLSAAAVASSDDLSAPLTTSTVWDPATRTVVLVGGGDVLLSTGSGDPTTVAGRAGLDDLAARTAAALRTEGARPRRVRLDTSALPGPRIARGWKQADVAAGYTDPVAAIGVATARARPGAPALDPEGTALRAFTRRLAAHGVRVTPTAGTTAAPRGATPLASVDSAPVGQVLAYAMEHSDNALTEGLVRRAAKRDAGSGSPRTNPQFIRTQLAARGFDLTGLSITDASGLGPNQKVPVRLVGDVLVAATATGADPVLPELRDVVAQLPVAGLDGTLYDRFATPGTRPAAGIARAKTGTLTETSALAGTTTTRDGRTLDFVVVASRVPARQGTLEARAALDEVVTALTACGCR